jgi:hypothetical protein
MNCQTCGESLSQQGSGKWYWCRFCGTKGHLRGGLMAPKIVLLARDVLSLLADGPDENAPAAVALRECLTGHGGE